MARFIGNSTTTTNVYTSDANHVHDQGSASATWVVTHNLSKYCSVTVVDTANTVVIGQNNKIKIKQKTTWQQ